MEYGQMYTSKIREKKHKYMHSQKALSWINQDILLKDTLTESCVKNYLIINDEKKNRILFKGWNSFTSFFNTYPDE